MITSDAVNPNATFGTVKRHQNEPLHKLRQIDWDEEQRKLQLEMPDFAVIDLLSEWIRDNIPDNVNLTIGHEKLDIGI